MKTKLLHQIVDLAIEITATKTKTVSAQYEGFVNALYVYIYDGEGKENDELKFHKAVYFGNLSTVNDFLDIKYMLEQMLNEAKKVA